GPEDQLPEGDDEQAEEERGEHQGDVVRGRDAVVTVPGRGGRHADGPAGGEASRASCPSATAQSSSRSSNVPVSRASHAATPRLTEAAASATRARASSSVQTPS